jgi:hypothetical protein
MDLWFLTIVGFDGYFVGLVSFKSNLLAFLGEKKGRSLI